MKLRLHEQARSGTSEADFRTAVTKKGGRSESSKNSVYLLRFSLTDKMNSENDFSRLELSVPACRNNYRYFRSLLKPSTRMLVLVKANAYGHGAVEFASMLQAEGADYLAVALPVEGIELRRSGISLPVLVLTAGTDFFPEIIDYRLEPGIPNLATLEAFCAVLKERGLKSYPVHIKLDTGMHRLGFMPDELPALEEFLKTHDEIRVKSVYSHLAAAEDSAEDEFTLSQIRLFEKGAAELSGILGYRPMWHVLNSAGIERFPQYQFDMVRLGIGIYGISALPGVRLDPVASLKVKVLQVKKLRPGDGTIGSGRRGHRHLGCGAASFSVNGHRAPTIGNICMDMCMLDVSGLGVKVGDTVTIFGKDPTISELAGILGTIPYEILTSVPHRIERIIVRK